MTTGTYVQTKLNDESGQLIEKLLKPDNRVPTELIENTLDPKEIHVTILYATQTFIPRRVDRSKTFVAKVEGYEILGEGKWQGLVLTLKSPAISSQFADFENLYGKGIHSYPSLNIHTTIKYRPEKGDLEKLKRMIPIGTFLFFKGLYIEPLNP